MKQKLTNTQMQESIAELTDDVMELKEEIQEVKAKHESADRQFAFAAYYVGRRHVKDQGACYRRQGFSSRRAKGRGKFDLFRAADPWICRTKEGRDR